MNIDTRWIEPYMTAGFLIESGETEKAREIYAKMKEDMAAAGEPEKNLRIIDNCIEVSYVQDEIIALKANGGDKAAIAELEKKKRALMLR